MRKKRSDRGRLKGKEQREIQRRALFKSIVKVSRTMKIENMRKL